MRALHSVLLAVTIVVASVLGLQSAGRAATGAFVRAGISHNYSATVYNVDQVPAARQLAFHDTWEFDLVNASGRVLTAPTISAYSGYAPSQFVGVTGWPLTASLPFLDLGRNGATATVLALDLVSQDTARLAPGFDSSRNTSPLVVQRGGATQVVTIAVTERDAQYGCVLTHCGGYVGVTVPMDIPGETGACGATSVPAGGAEVGPWQSCRVLADGSVNWQACAHGCMSWNGSSWTWENAVDLIPLGTTATFTVVLTVPNASGRPILHNAPVRVQVGAVAGGTQNVGCADVASGSPLWIADPTLDGANPGSGGAWFSTADTGLEWRVDNGLCPTHYWYRVDYE